MRAVWAVVVIGMAGVVSAAEPRDEFLRVVPADANSVMVLKVRELIESPRGKSEGWAEKHQDAFLEGTQQIPPWVSVVYRASRLRPEESSTLWSVGLAVASLDIPIEQIAEHEQAPVELVGGVPCIQNRRGAFLSSLAPRLVSIFTPGYRQDFARWLAFSRKNQKPQLSPFLEQAVTDSSAPIVVAIDLQDAFPPGLVFAWLQHSPRMKNSGVDAPSLATLLQGLRGVRLEATVADTTQARLSLEFSSPVEVPGELIKGLTLEFLEHSGAVLDDLEGSRVEVSGSTVTLSLTLSDAGLRRILSLVTAPNPISRPGMGTPQTETPRDHVSRDASRKYYLAVVRMVDDLINRHQRAKNYEKTAVWHENFAKKIDQLSIDGVHRDLSQYAAEVSSQFRALAASLRGAQLEVNVLEGTLSYTVRVDPGFGAVNVWGGVGYRPSTWQVDTNLQAVRQQQADAVLRGAAQRDLIWTQIEKDRKQIRRRMQEIFQVDFEAK